VALCAALALVAALFGCISQSPATPPSPETPTGTPPPQEIPAPSTCVLVPIVVPTPPAEMPGYTELDPTTGLHMTGKPQEVDLESYRLRITGKVEQPLSLSYDYLRCLPGVEISTTLACPGFFEDQGTWAGARFEDVLALAGMQDGVFGLRLIGADGYRTSVAKSVALAETSIFAYEWGGKPLPIFHGFPVRAALPGRPGTSWAKWLVEIKVY
jgi:DMSO/TMAO reductase YedYZ molybdopterin-dependent catalytic subunit